MSVQVQTKQNEQVRLCEACRVCGRGEMVELLSLGDQYVSNFVDAGQEDLVHAPLDLMLCDAGAGGCGLVQLRHTVAAEAMYRNYWYRSGVNQTMRDALADIVRGVEERLGLKDGDVVVDIGSNDNTLLKAFSNDKLVKVGFEPATSMMPYAKEGATEVINNFFTAGELGSRGYGLAKCITSIAMFYDLDEPNKFVADIKQSLAPDGLGVIQMAYLPVMLKDNIFDNICHEHLEYYSLMSLENLLKGHGLKVVDVELNDVNGGSIRTYIMHEGVDVPVSERVEELRREEQALGLGNSEAYREFARRVEDIKDQVTSFIKGEVGKGKKVYVYGASTKGNTLLQYFGLDSCWITAAAERNPDKYGKKTVATGIPIISEQQARAEQPDYFLVLPWHFMKEFVIREKDFLARGGKFIAPLPEFKIITS